MNKVSSLRSNSGNTLRQETVNGKASQRCQNSKDVQSVRSAVLAWIVYRRIDSWNTSVCTGQWSPDEVELHMEQIQSLQTRRGSVEFTFSRFSWFPLQFHGAEREPNYICTEEILPFVSAPRNLKDTFGNRTSGNSDLLSNDKLLNTCQADDLPIWQLGLRRRIRNVKAGRLPFDGIQPIPSSKANRWSIQTLQQSGFEHLASSMLATIFLQSIAACALVPEGENMWRNKLQFFCF